MACKKAIEFSIEAGFLKLVIEGDNVNVMRAISSPLANKTLLGHIYEDIRSYLDGLHLASLSWIKRGGGDIVDHLLAQYARNISDEMYWLEDSPPPAVVTLYQDSLHLIE